MRLPLRYLYVLFCLFTLSNQTYAQTIIVPPDSLPTAVSRKVISYATLYVNGQFTNGLTDNMATSHVNTENINKILVTLATLRLVSNDQIKLRESISLTLSHIIERNPFRVAVTPHHILTETAGFAVPVRLTPAPLSYYASHVRTAGQMSHDDKVGWAVLVSFLETKTGHPIEQIILNQILQPLGLTEADFHMPDTPSPLLKMVGATGSGKLIAEIARVMIRNRTNNGERYLPAELHDLMVKQQSWRMHPLTPSQGYGNTLFWSDKQRWAEPSHSQPNKPSFMAFPEAGIAFVNLAGLTPEYRAAVTKFANEVFLPIKEDNRLNEASMLVPYERFNGHYVRADAPTGWLKDRLQAINNHELYIREALDGRLHLKLPDSDVTILYEKQAPFHYAGPAGNTLTLSPFKSGGYLMLEGVLYRYASILGNSLFVIDLFPFVVILLLSSGFYARSSVSKSWQRMGQFGSIGTLLICGGLLCDYLWWPVVLYEWEMPMLIVIWRIVLNIGLMLVLSLPMFALSFVRTNTMPTGPALMVVPFHLALISIAAAVLFLILIAWGIAAEFSAY